MTLKGVLGANIQRCTVESGVEVAGPDKVRFFPARANRCAIET